MVRRFLQQAAYKMGQFMIGRYGNDELNRALMIASLVCLVLSIFWGVFYLVALALMLWSIFRTYSKNIPARMRERDTYNRLIGKVCTKCRLYKRMWVERKTHRYFKCKQCKAVIRIPKGRGEVDVGCPRCHTRTKRKS